MIYTKKNAPPKKKLRASADRHGKKTPNDGFTGHGKEQFFLHQRVLWEQVDTNPHPDQDRLRAWRRGGDGAGGRAGGGWDGDMEQEAQERAPGELRGAPPRRKCTQWVPSEYAFLSHYYKIMLWFYF